MKILLTLLLLWVLTPTQGLGAQEHYPTIGQPDLVQPHYPQIGRPAARTAEPRPARPARPQARQRTQLARPRTVAPPRSHSDVESLENRVSKLEERTTTLEQKVSSREIASTNKPVAAQPNLQKSSALLAMTDWRTFGLVASLIFLGALIGGGLMAWRHRNAFKTVTAGGHTRIFKTLPGEKENSGSKHKFPAAMCLNCEKKIVIRVPRSLEAHVEENCQSQATAATP